MKKILYIVIFTLLFTENIYAETKKEKVKIYKGWSIPQYVKPDPNLATIKHYFKKDYKLIKDPQMGFYKIKPKGNHQEFEKKLEVSQFLKDQMNSTSLLSYLYYEKDLLVYDEITPKKRLGKLYKNNTPWISNSVGKSIVSYLVGNAICEGKIKSIDVKINDWSLIENTLYHNQRLIDLLIDLPCPNRSIPWIWLPGVLLVLGQGHPL